MKAIAVALVMGIIFAIIGGLMYSKFMEKMARENNVQTDIKVGDARSGKVKLPS